MGESDQIAALESRLDLWLVAETDELLCDEQGHRKV